MGRADAVDTVIRILKGAVHAKASDIHLRAGSAPQVRIDDELCPLEHPPLTPAVIEAGVRALAQYARVPPEKLDRLQVDFSCVVPDVGRFRAHCYRQGGSQAVVLRCIPSEIPDFAKLRLPRVIKRIAGLRDGLLIVTGATRNGKSTTIASVLDYINRHEPRHVITLEDPIEYVFEDNVASFSQREVGRDLNSMQDGLESALRADPDIVFIGEVRTPAEFDVALHAAESGRLVVTTLHSGDCIRAISRMVHFYPADQRDSVRQRLADNLAAIIAQRLVPKRGGRSRILVTEVLTRSPTVQDCVRDPARLRALPAALDKASHEYGSHSFDQQLVRMVRDGLISLDTAKGVANSPSDLVRTLKVTR